MASSFLSASDDSEADSESSLSLYSDTDFADMAWDDDNPTPPSPSSSSSSARSPSPSLSPPASPASPQRLSPSPPEDAVPAPQGHTRLRLIASIPDTCAWICIAGLAFAAGLWVRGVHLSPSPPRDDGPSPQQQQRPEPQYVCNTSTALLPVHHALMHVAELEVRIEEMLLYCAPIVVDTPAPHPGPDIVPVIYDLGVLLDHLFSDLRSLELLPPLDRYFPPTRPPLFPTPSVSEWAVLDALHCAHLMIWGLANMVIDYKPLLGWGFSSVDWLARLVEDLWTLAHEAGRGDNLKRYDWDWHRSRAAARDRAQDHWEQAGRERRGRAARAWTTRRAAGGSVRTLGEEEEQDRDRNDRDILVEVLFRSVSRELGPPNWPALHDRGEWLGWLYGNLTVALEGLEAAVAASGCATPRRPPHEAAETWRRAEGDQTDGATSASQRQRRWWRGWRWWWWWPRPPGGAESRRRVRQEKEAQRRAAEMQALCHNVERHIAPRLAVLKAFAETNGAAVLVLHREAEARTADLRIAACEWLIGIEACRDPDAFERVDWFFFPEAKKDYWHVDGPPPHLGDVSVALKNPWENEAWFGEFEVVVRGEEHDDDDDDRGAGQGSEDAKSADEKARWTAWWRRRETVGCRKPRFHFPWAEDMASELLRGWERLVVRREEMKEAWRSGSARWRLHERGWREVWESTGRSGDGNQRH